MSDLAATLRVARERLADVGSPAPRAEAERLAAHVLRLKWGELWARMSEPLDARSVRAIDDALTRRIGGEPVAYIEGSAPFWGMELGCGPGVLVPRPETETLVEVALELIAGLERPVVVDVGTGSGAVAIAIVKERPDADVSGTDVSAAALAWAERNASAFAPGVRFARGDLFDALPARSRGRVDLVVSNPPYVPDGADLPQEVCAEPREALRAGPRGDEILLRLVSEAPRWLRTDHSGALALEVGTGEQAATITKALGAFQETGVRDDHNGRPRVVWGRR